MTDSFGKFGEHQRNIPTIPERVLRQGIRPTLEALQKMIPRENIVGAVNELRAHSEDSLADIESLSRKAEINALAGHFAEHIWAETRDWLREHPGEIGDFSEYAKASLEMHKKLDKIPHGLLREIFERDEADGLKKLRKFSQETLRFHVVHFIHRNRTAENPQGALS